MEKLGIGITAESSQEQQEPQAVKEEATPLLPPEPPEPELPEGPPILKQSETIAEDISLPVDNNIDSTTTIPSRFNFQGDVVYEPVIKTAPLQSSQLKSTDFMTEAQAIKEDEESKTENELRQEHHFIQSVHNVIKYKMPDEYEYMTDDEVMDAGLDYIGQVNYNIPSAIAATLDYDEADDLTLSSLAYMMSAYEDKKISVQGTMRLGYGLITDPSTYIGVGTFGFGGAAKVVGQMTAEKALNNYILSRMGLTSAESALYSGGGTALYQNLEQKTGAREGYDEGEIALATGLGAVFPKVLETGVKGAAKGISKVGDWAEGGMAQAAGGGIPNKHQVAAAYDDALTNIPTIGLGELEGKKIVPIVADLTKAGSNYTGIDSTVTEPVALMGGGYYPILKSSKDGGVVWANEGASVSTKLAKNADEDGYVYGVVTNMLEDSHASNTSVVHSVLETFKAYSKEGRISKTTEKVISKHVRDNGKKLQKDGKAELAKQEKKNPKTEDTIQKKKDAIKAANAKIKAGEELEKMPELDADNMLDWADNATFETRKAIISQLRQKKIKNMEGMPNINKILNATIESDFTGGNWGDGQVVIKMNVNDTVKLGEDGTDTIAHPSYQYGIKGEVVGKFGRPMNKESLFPTFHAQRRADESSPTSDPRAFDLSRPAETVTPQLIAENKTTPYKHIKSANQASMVRDAAQDNWKTSNTAVKDGGISTAKLQYALMDSEASDSLSQYNYRQMDKKVREGKATYYELGDSEAYFSLDKDTDYSYLNNKQPIPGLTGKETSLNSVINNTTNSPGTGGLLVSKAVEEGAEVLDAFNVKTIDKPDGILSSFYAKHGFEVVHTAPFNKEAFLDGAPDSKLNDTIEVWKKQGWNPEDGYPDVVVMKYTGDENGRAGATKRLLTTGSSVPTEGSQKLDKAGIPGPVSDGGDTVQGDKPGAGNINAMGGEESRGSGKSDVSAVFQELESLSPPELKNLFGGRYEN